MRRSEAMRAERFSARTVDVGGALGARRLGEIRDLFEEFGALHLTNTGLTSEAEATEAMAGLGFAAAEQFTAGGRTSEGVQQKWAAPGLRRLDYYPPALYLLPNNEVQYQRCSPARVLFYCRRAPAAGGRTFLHSALAVEAEIRGAGPAGVALIEKLERHGMTIETGFLDRRHPASHENYFQPWQERFATDDPEIALLRARERRLEYDECWLREEDSPPGSPPICTLMTRITLSAFKRDRARGARYLRFPRLALDPPGARNGYRRFPLGNGEELTEEERAILLAAYLATREGTAWRAGDLILFDNARYGHSRESFEGEREVFVGMAGLLWDDATPEAAALTPAPPRPPPPRLALDAAAGGERYALPESAREREQRFSARTFDAGGELTPACVAALLGEFDRHGAVHVRNTGLRLAREADLPEETLRALRFGGEDAFPWGGMSSGRTTRTALGRELRATDEYPPERWLLPHNEVLYQRRMPSRLLFFSAASADPARGGRTFVHSAARLESWIGEQGPAGEALLASLRAHGFLIEMGFLDERHPAKAQNYFRSWQDRFQTSSREEAAARCQAATHQFDACWWVEEPTPPGPSCWTLMTRIRIPAYHHDAARGRDYLFFPRIASDGPRIENGYRRYPRGNGEAFSDAEIDLLLGAFLATREGVHYAAGDLLLVDNVRHGHSREAFDPPRSLGVALGGEFRVHDPAEGR